MKDELERVSMSWILAVRDAAIRVIGDVFADAIKDCDANLYQHPSLPKALELLRSRLSANKSTVEMFRQYCNAMEMLDLIEFTNNHEPKGAIKQ